jgi:hypothetical protein
MVAHVVGTLALTVHSDQSGANAMTTLDEARQGWKATIADKGGHCPCCDRWGKVYRHHISGANAKALLWMAKHTDPSNPWLDMPNVAPREILRTYSFATLHHWNLIQRAPMVVGVGEDGQETKYSGLWKVTPMGHHFARGKIQIPKYVYTYNNSVVDSSTETVYLRDCFGKKFNYDEIMSTTWGETWTTI